VGKYSFVNRKIKSWNQLPASLLASFLVNYTHLKRGLRMWLQAGEFKWGMSVNK